MKVKLTLWHEKTGRFSVVVESDELRPETGGEGCDYDDAEALANVMFPAANFSSVEVLDHD